MRSIVFLLVSLSAIAQQIPETKPQPTITTINGHQMGETMQQWLARGSNEIDKLAQACRSKNVWEEEGTDKQICQSIPDILAGKLAEFDTGKKDRTFTWKFINGKLAEVKINIPSLNVFYDVNIDQEFFFLTERYGKPSELKTVPYQNGYGAEFKCIEGVWHMPDGIHIEASDTVYFYRGIPGIINSQYKHRLLVLFESKEFLDQESVAHPVVNPY